MKKALKTLGFILITLAPMMLCVMIGLVYVALAYFVVNGAAQMDPLMPIIVIPVLFAGLIVLVCAALPTLLDWMTAEHGLHARILARILS